MSKSLPTTSHSKHLLGVTLIFGLVWLRSSYGKFTGGEFAAALGPTLTKFASNNPYAWFQDFLRTTAIPNSMMLAPIVMYSEAIVALLMVFSSLYLMLQKKNRLASTLLLVGLVGGAALNLLFWLAAGWTSPSTDSLNLLMLAVELFASFVLLKELI